MQPPAEGPVALELWLLSQMRAESRKDAALAALGLDPPAMQQAVQYVGETLGLHRPGHSIDPYRRMLGAPLESDAEPNVGPTTGFAGSLRHRFHLPLWPDLDFVVRSHREGWAWGPELVRRAGAPVPDPRRIEEIEPWSMLETEVRARFGPFSDEYPFNYSNEAYYSPAPPPSEPHPALLLLFDFGLVQQVKPD